MNVCLRCNMVYFDHLIAPENELEQRYCPNVNCYGLVVELDELIARTIMILNNKGYFTTFCCSGHWYEEHCQIYIGFIDEFAPKEIPSFAEWDDDRKVFRVDIKESDKDKKFNKIIELNEKLYEWAKQLPATSISR